MIDIPLLENLYLERNVVAISRILEGINISESVDYLVVSSLIELLYGRHLNILRRLDFSVWGNICEIIAKSENPIEIIANMLDVYVAINSDDDSRKRKFYCLIVGVACLEIYCEMNYTGPELLPMDLLFVEPIYDNQLHQMSLRLLECDGEYPFSLCSVPHCLLLARLLLSFVAEPNRTGGWRLGIILEVNGNIVRPTLPSKEKCVISTYKSSFWWSARAAVIHLRLLHKQSFEILPSLWFECKDLFSQCILHYTEAPAPNKLATLLWLEWGLCCHHFEYGDKGKASFRKAQQAAGLQAEMTAFLGKRTKYQHHDLAQLVIATSSSLATSVTGTTSPAPPAISDSVTSERQEVVAVTVNKLALFGEDSDSDDDSNDKDNTMTTVRPAENVTSADEASTAIVTEPRKEEEEVEVEDTTVTSQQQHILHDSSQVADTEEVTVENIGADATAVGWQHGDWELGRRLVLSGEGGEEAAVREVLLDSMDGGAIENILLEGGPKFTKQEANKVVTGALHTIDQLVLLAICLDVKNSNPEDGLTNEEMLPYIEKVLNNAQNWMVHSTGLLQRSWLEFERRKTADRAMLQIQALLDQHTTKLTISQSTHKVIEDSAPVQDRLEYIYALSYPAQYELKRDLARRYLSYNVLQSALLLFRELQMWDEVVTCYQLLGKPHRAELVVRERLREEGETPSPYMLTSLGDLTGDISCYERAWIISRKRYARAKRTLARLCYDRKQWSECVSHLEEALAIQPLVSHSWYLIGLCCMQLEDWEKAIVAFTRCVQQDGEVAEAWANIGAVHMKCNRLNLALPALYEAIKQQQDNWRVLENILTVCLGLKRFREAASTMEKLLALRHKSHRPLFINELRQLVRAVGEDPSIIHPRQDKTKAVGEEGQNQDQVKEEEGIPIAELSYTVKAVDRLLDQCTFSVPGDALLWDVCAVFNIFLGRYSKAKECRLKQFRAAVAVTNWEKEEDGIKSVLIAAHCLVAAHTSNQASKVELYACKSLLTSALRKIELFFATSEYYKELISLLKDIEKEFSIKES